jgi:hypothetical protein
MLRGGETGIGQRLEVQNSRQGSKMVPKGCPRKRICYGHSVAYFEALRLRVHVRKYTTRPLQHTHKMLQALRTVNLQEQEFCRVQQIE